ncbi:hypothetical protein [Pontibacter chitinilyticus]|uniref:hypothetical protein n=1 Tax=Pontibacter chitinilyticus TaxID=2674989 RepID=UPI00321BE2C4
MDFVTTTIGLLCIILLILPFLYVSRKNKLKSRKLLQDFLDRADQQQLTISHYDFWDPFYAIGIDKNKKRLFYTRSQTGTAQQVLIDLSEVGRFWVNKLSKETHGNMVIDHIELVFSYRNQKHQEKVLEFYSKEENLNLTDELRLSEKWKQIINESLATIPESTVRSGHNR